MKKVYQKPEFQIIVQNQANAKFFVASGEAPGFTSTNPTDGPTDSASQYGEGGNFNL